MNFDEVIQLICKVQFQMHTLRDKDKKSRTWILSSNDIWIRQNPPIKNVKEHTRHLKNILHDYTMNLQAIGYHLPRPPKHDTVRTNSYLRLRYVDR